MNRIDVVKNKFSIMTHVVAGYPDIETSRELVLVMAESGVDLIEIQIPFSDPLADGPTIMHANQVALDNGIKVRDCLEMVESLRKEISIPLLFMSYANIPFAYGMGKFMDESIQAGVDGLIIPDLPFDEKIEYIDTARKKNIYPIQVVSPDVQDERLNQILGISQGFVYTTLKVGITGAGKEIGPQGRQFISDLKQKTSLPVLAGFGISSEEHVNQLRYVSDGVVIGSHIINLFNKNGIIAVKDFLTRISG